VGEDVAEYNNCQYSDGFKTHRYEKATGKF